MTTILLIAAAQFKRPPTGLLAALAHAVYQPGDTVEVADPESAAGLIAAKLARPANVHTTAAGAVGKLTADGSDFEFEYRAHDGGTVARRGGETDWRLVNADGKLGALARLPKADADPSKPRSRTRFPVSPEVESAPGSAEVAAARAAKPAPVESVAEAPPPTPQAERPEVAGDPPD